ncbi:uncharacterized protein LOC127264736 [Andrographis paniculata]|uniref:uncharacterized protein LOC127264736 n=1 Tax=Andrographis paniculata TaxID=175694 RepID=UPI0021E8A967|nr:uncharacterized protein LOC127264736 [Andrographis paniculata]
MEGLRKAYSDAVAQAQESKAKLTSLASSLEKTNKPLDSLPSSSSSSYSTDHSRLLLARPSRQFVSLWTCSKICAICFVAGVFVGYTLKRRVRRWASKLLRRLKDD